MDDFLEATKYRSGAKEHRFFFARSASGLSAAKGLLLPEHLKIVHDEAFADGNVQTFFNDKSHFEIEIDAFEILTVYRQPQRLQVGKLMQQGLKYPGAEPLSLLTDIQVKFVQEISAVRLFTYSEVAQCSAIILHYPELLPVLYHLLFERCYAVHPAQHVLNLFIGDNTRIVRPPYAVCDLVYERHV